MTDEEVNFNNNMINSRRAGSSNRKAVKITRVRGNFNFFIN